MKPSFKGKYFNDMNSNINNQKLLTKTLENPPCSSFIEYLFELQMLPIEAKPLTADLEAGEAVVSALNKSLLFYLFAN